MPRRTCWPAMAIASGSSRRKTIAASPRRATTRVDQALGDFVAFLDADDTWLPGRLEKTIAALEAHPTTTMAFSDVVPVGANNRPLAPTFMHPGMARPPLMEDLLEEGQWPILPSSVTMRRWVFGRVGGFAEEYKGAAGFEDTELWFLLREMGDFAFVPEPLVNYRLDPDGRTLAQVRAWLRAVRGADAQALRRAGRQTARRAARRCTTGC